MALKAIVESLDGVPEALQEHYTEKDGKFYLDAEGVEDVSGLKSALQKERENRKTLSQQLEEFKAKIGDLDPEKAREALKKLDEMESKKLLDEGEFEKLLEKRISQAKKDHENQVTALNKKLEERESELQTVNGRLSELVIDQTASQALLKAGAREDALPFLLREARDVYKMKDGQPVPVDKDGNTVYGSDPSKPMPFNEWAGNVLKEHPFLSKPSTGSGATNTTQGRGGEFTISAEEARDFSKFEALQEAAAKAGQTVQVTE